MISSWENFDLSNTFKKRKKKSNSESDKSGQGKPNKPGNLLGNFVKSQMKVGVGGKEEQKVQTAKVTFKASKASPPPKSPPPKQPQPQPQPQQPPPEAPEQPAQAKPEPKGNTPPSKHIEPLERLINDITKQMAHQAKLETQQNIVYNAGGDLPDYSNCDISDARNRLVFKAARDLLKKLVTEEDLTAKKDGSRRWWPEKIIKSAVKYRYTQMMHSKYERPLINNVVFFMDISGSVSGLAQLFMSIIGGVIGCEGVHVVVGQETHADQEICAKRPYTEVNTALFDLRRVGYLSSTQGGIRTMNNLVAGKFHGINSRSFERGVKAFLNAKGIFNRNTYCVFFGDLEGTCVHLAQMREIVKTCKCMFLYTNSHDYGKRRNSDYQTMKETGIKIFDEISTGAKFIAAMKHFDRIKRPS